MGFAFMVALLSDVLTSSGFLEEGSGMCEEGVGQCKGAG